MLAHPGVPRGEEASRDGERRLGGQWIVGYEYGFFGVNLGKPVYVFGRSNWGDAELEKLKELTTLTQLDVDGCRGVTDAGMEHLQGMNNLKWLNISHTQVTEAGLKHLTSVTNLETLLICCLYQADGRKKISEEAIRELQEALPNCEIVGP